MATLHETAYPRLKPDPTAKELEEIYTPTAAEIAFAKQLTTQPGPQLAVLILSLIHISEPTRPY